MIITFCGHSQYTETDRDKQLVLDLLNQFIGDKPAKLYLGGYGAFDAFAKRCGKEYQQTHPKTKLIFVTPYITVGYQNNHLNQLKEQYDEILYPGLEKTPAKFAILKRNQWMIDQADCVIAYIAYSTGGAYKTYQYAQRKRKLIFNIHLEKTNATV